MKHNPKAQALFRRKSMQGQAQDQIHIFPISIAEGESLFCMSHAGTNLPDKMGLLATKSLTLISRLRSPLHAQL